MLRIKLLGLAIVAMLMLALPAAAVARGSDADRDGLPDRWEARHHFSVHAKSAAADTDRDGLSNRGEYDGALNPRDGDTDNDGIKDGAEDGDSDGVTNEVEEDAGTDLDDADSDDDGVADGEEGGHVNPNDAKDGNPTDGNAGWGNDDKEAREHGRSGEHRGGGGDDDEDDDSADEEEDDSVDEDQ